MDRKNSNFTIREKKYIQAEYDSLVTNLLQCNIPGDRELIDKAFNVANKAHWNMRRSSGEPYIIHTIAVAKIVNQEIGLGARSIATALLHDSVENTDYTLENVNREFGPKIASLIDGLTKISGTYDKDTSSSMQAENFRRMLLTLSEDLRVILIKIADRLHYMRTLDSIPETKKMKVAGETLFLYAPLANRIGLYAIKSEFEDLSFKYRQPVIYEEISSKMKNGEKKYYAFINKFCLPIINKLNESDLKFEICGRPKSIFSIWKKMHSKNVPFEEIYDILAVRIVFEPLPGIPEKTTCWNIYSTITDSYLPKPDKLRDWVTMPKPNGYEALHVTVKGPEGHWVEVQIRSQRMNEIAERGYSVLYKYKDDISLKIKFNKLIRGIQSMLENPLEDPLEFLDEGKMNLNSSEIVVFTPKGNLVNLPKGACALDYAYEIHPDIGNKTVGVKINNKLSPINSILNSGDQIEIITADKAKPEILWISFVKTSKAKEAIRKQLQIESSSSTTIQKGMEILEAKLGNLGLVPSTHIIKKLMVFYNTFSKDELFLRIEDGTISLDNILKIIKKRETKNPL